MSSEFHPDSAFKITNDGNYKEWFTINIDGEVVDSSKDIMSDYFNEILYTDSKIVINFGGIFDRVKTDVSFKRWTEIT